MSVSIKIDHSQIDQISKQIVRSLSTMRRAFAVVGEMAITEVHGNFDEQGRPHRWAKLADTTLFAKIGGSRGYTKKGALRAKSKRVLAKNKILTDTATLRRSISRSLGPDFVDIGTNVVYAARHNFGYEGGTGRGRSRTPQREFMVFSEGMIERAHKVLGDYVFGARNG